MSDFDAVAVGSVIGELLAGQEAALRDVRRLEVIHKGIIRQRDSAQNALAAEREAAAKARNVARKLWRRTYPDFNVIEPKVYDRLMAENPWLDEDDE